MSIDLRDFFQACNPGATLDVANPEDRKYYIDFSSARSGNLIRELKRTVTFSNQPTCQLFTGHIGCGKSTELLRLKAELEDQDYHVVYLESSDNLDMADIDITDILLLIVRKISESLIEIRIDIQPGYFRGLFSEIADIFRTEADFSGETEFSSGLARITAKTKANPRLRTRLRACLEARSEMIINSVNTELLEPATKQLKEIGKQGLAVIVDNLDRIDNRRIMESGRTQPQYIFLDRGEQLKKLKCHLVYTIPYTLIFSNDANMLNSRFGVKPKILSMVPVQSREGTPYETGLGLLRQMVMARAFPYPDQEERLNKTGELFENAGMLDRLCQVSGGHVRNLLILLFSCLQKEDPPFSEDILQKVIQEHQDDLVKTITPDELELLGQVAKNQNVAGEEEYLILLRSMFVFEYQDEKGAWFSVNPLLDNLLKGKH